MNKKTSLWSSISVLTTAVLAVMAFTVSYTHLDVYKRQGLSEEQAHIAKFGEYMCGQLIDACAQAYDNIRAAA